MGSLFYDQFLFAKETQVVDVILAGARGAGKAKMKGGRGLFCRGLGCRNGDFGGRDNGVKTGMPPGDKLKVIRNNFFHRGRKHDLAPDDQHNC